MKVAFYGTRGSTPVPDPDFVQFDGNTSCILLTFDSGRIAILDAGTGIRKLGNDLIAVSHEQYDNIFILDYRIHIGTIFHVSAMYGMNFKPQIFTDITMPAL